MRVGADRLASSAQHSPCRRPEPSKAALILVGANLFHGVRLVQGEDGRTPPVRTAEKLPGRLYLF